MAHKELWADRLKWILISAIVILFAEHYVAPIFHWDTKKHILNELQYGRDKLQIASASFELGWHRNTNVKFIYESKVSEAINYENGEKVLKMYQALNNGISEAIKLDQELDNTTPDKLLSQKSAIVRSLDAVDQLGPSVANYLGGTWRIISKDLPPLEIINQLEKIVVVTGSSAETSVTTHGFRK
jgi:hypothetical protein